MSARVRLAWWVTIVAVTLAVAHCRRVSLAESPLPTTRAPVSTGRSMKAGSLPGAPPITLTSSDGTGAELRTLSGRAVLEGPLAFTELRLGFVNPESRTREGTFRIALPQGASISRFAMLVGNQWQEGEVVERQRAQAVYEDFLHRKRDPALLEHSCGNEFSARVFPIPPHATKELLVSYSEELLGAKPYVLPLVGLPRLGTAEVSVSASGSSRPFATLRETDWAPASDFVVDRASVASGRGLRSGDLVLARVQASTEPHPDPLGSAVVLVDTSASRALGLEEETRLLEELSARLDRGDSTWTVACFDQGVNEVYSGPRRGFGAAATEKIRARGALGASDLSRALAWAQARARAVGAVRVLVVTDGVPTAGETDRARLAALVRAMAADGLQRLDAIAVGGIRDGSLLRAIATAGLERDGVAVDAGEGADVIARRLGTATQSHLAVAVDGASWSYPPTIDGVQAGDEFLVYAEVPDATTVAVSVGESTHLVLDLHPVERPLLARAWAQAKIASLLAHDGERRDDPASASHRALVGLPRAQPLHGAARPRNGAGLRALRNRAHVAG